MITAREWLQAALRRGLPDWAQVSNIRYWQDMFERMRRESLAAGTDPPEYLLCNDAVRRAVESETGVPLEALEEDGLWRVYRDADDTPATSDADAEESDEETPASRVAKAEESYTAHRDLLLSPLLRPAMGAGRGETAWENAAEC